MAIAELRVLQKLNEYEFGVELWLMRDRPNENRWNYQNIGEFYLTFLGTPILCAYVNGRIGLGHEMKEKMGPNGEMYYSFTDGTSERIVGTISSEPEDIRLAEKDGATWIVAKGRLFRFYNAELVNKIIKRGVMEVSVETEVLESYMDGDIEVFTKWTALGVTILGEGVAPAIPGANIKRLAEMREEFNSVLLKAASYIANADEGDEPDEDNDDPEEEEKEGDTEDETGEAADPDEEDDDDPDKSPDDSVTETNKAAEKNNSKGEKTMNVLHKRQVAELAAQYAENFAGYSVLSAGQDENGMHFCLMAADGSAALYTRASEDELFDARKIQKINTCVSYKVGEEQIDVDTCDFTDSLNAKLIASNTERDAANEKLAKAEATIESMKAAELKRRVSAAKSAAQATLEKFNANRDEKVSDSILTAINEAIDHGDYSDCLNGEGEWCGEEEVCTAVLAKCAEEVMKFDKAQVARNSTHYIWGEEHKAHANDEGVGALLDSWRAKKI